MINDNTLGSQSCFWFRTALSTSVENSHIKSSPYLVLFLYFIFCAVEPGKKLVIRKVTTYLRRTGKIYRFWKLKTCFTQIEKKILFWFSPARNLPFICTRCIYFTFLIICVASILLDYLEMHSKNELVRRSVPRVCLWKQYENNRTLIVYQKSILLFSQQSMILNSLNMKPYF